ncbi:TPA: deoxyribonuclease V [bacterium]|nr:deoxyribonuclease V [bacterium]
MKYLDLHKWNISYDEAIKIQHELSNRVIIQPFKTKPKLIAGADVSYSKGSDLFFSGVVIFQMPDLFIVEESTAQDKVDFPYIPGLLSFRESPVLLKAFDKLKTVPDVVILDGQGIAHPRGLGIASHIGLILDIPTIGCAKNVLVGKYETPSIEAGEYTPLIYNNKAVGVALRTKKNVSPVFVSPGYKIDIPSAIEIVLNFCRGYRLPEPTRQAHLLVNRVRITRGV